MKKSIFVGLLFFIPFVGKAQFLSSFKHNMYARKIARMERGFKKLNDKTFIFWDPPYLDSFNDCYFKKESRLLKDNVINDNTKMFIDIKNYLDNDKVKQMLIINKNSITEYIYNKYIVGFYKKLYQLTKNKTEHLIICNYKKT